MAAPLVLFAASLVDTNGNAAVSTNADCSALTIVDSSNYLTNTEQGHDITQFSYFRRILIEHYLGTTINLSSLGDGDVLISPAISGLNSFAQAITTGDGRYQITLRTVPNWNAAFTYDAGSDCVCVPNINPALSKFYLALTTNTNLPPASNPTDWQEIVETDLPIKYNTSLFICIDCDLLQCITDKTECALCVMGDAFCSVDLFCTNKCFLDASKLLLIYYGIQIDVQNQNAEAVDKKFSFAKTICEC